jgi:ketosteroid isomerase-like protein
MKTPLAYGFVLFALPLCFCQGPNGTIKSDQQPTISLPADLARVLEDYERAWMKRDAQALASLFTEDGFVLSPSSPMVRGRENIRRHYQDAGGPLALRAVAFSSEGNVGYVIGAFSERGGAPDRGKFTLTLRRDRSGRWLIFSDMDNGNIAPQTSRAPAR